MGHHACQTRVECTWEHVDAAEQVARLLGPATPCALCDIHFAVERSPYATPGIDRVHPARGDVEHLPAGSESVTRPRSDGCDGRCA